MKGSLIGLVAAGLLTVSAVVGVGCSSSSSGGGGGSTPPGVYCNTNLGGVQTCYGYSNLNSDQTNAVTMECTSSLMGTVASSCPTSGQVGCCQSTVSGYTINECYYCGSASTYQMACTAQSGATWTAGSGGPATCGAGDDGGTSEGGSTPDSGTTTQMDSGTGTD
jgi:hypothetical protein